MTIAWLPWVRRRRARAIQRAQADQVAEYEAARQRLLAAARAEAHWATAPTAAQPLTRPLLTPGQRSRASDPGSAQ